MKILIAIPSCHALRHWHEAVRSTWGKDIKGADLRFFLGSLPQAEDEVELNVGDSLYALTHKVVEMCRWAQGQGYDFVFKCDLDTFVRPLWLLESDFCRFDWVGGQNSFFASGGAGYWLSNKAMQAVLQHAIEPGPAEDVNTAHALLSKGFTLHHDPRFLFVPGQTIQEDTITYHLSSVKTWGAKATVEDLRAAYAGTFRLPLFPQPQSVRLFRRLR